MDVHRRGEMTSVSPRFSSLGRAIPDIESREIRPRPLQQTARRSWHMVKIGPVASSRRDGTPSTSFAGVKLRMGWISHTVERQQLDSDGEKWQSSFLLK